MVLDRFIFGSWWHGLFIIAPIIVCLLLYFLLRKRSLTTRYIVGVIIGIASLAVLIMRNVDIYLHNGFDPEIIPLQVCHFGNILVFITLIFRSKVTGAATFSLNVISAFVSLIEAQSLANYSNVWSIRAQAYIWGHLLIVIGGIYAISLRIVRVKWIDFLKGCGLIICFLIPGIIMNSYFNDFMKGSFNHINYFYIYDSEGVPFEFLYGLVSRSKYGWFTIDWVYTISVFALGLCVMSLIFLTQYLIFIKKDFDTHHIFYKLIHKGELKVINVDSDLKENIKIEEPITNYIKVNNSKTVYDDYISTPKNIIVVKSKKEDKNLK